MTPGMALEALGATRTIWIDDHFADSALTLADMLINKAEVARSCGFGDIGHLLTFREEDDDDARQQLAQELTDLGQVRRSAIKDAFLAKEREVDHDAGRELLSSDVDEACRLLGIQAGDRWTFDGAEAKLAEECARGDGTNAYIIDLKDAASPAEIAATRGVALLATLARNETKGTLFVLTHEATRNDEAVVEATLRAELKGKVDPRSIPICVIAKERLDSTVEPDMACGLCVAIKRAGLRRSMHEVLEAARRDLQKAFDDAQTRLLEIAPEQLDSFVVERAYEEGASELHVVERALTASIGSSLRETFARDAGIRTSSVRLRALRAVELPKRPEQRPDQNLRTFRDYETWESDSLLNGSLTPITCGDVFEIDGSGTGTAPPKRFLLLGQACDMALRPGKDRDQELAILVPLKFKGEASSGGTAKKPILPFTDAGRELTCDFRSASPVRLSVLDLASFREDGKVRFDEEQVKSPQLRDAQARRYDSRCAAPLATIARQKAAATEDAKAAPHDPDLQLTFASSDEFKRIRFGRYEQPPPKLKGATAEVPVHKVTWSLRRCGRVRAPYASFLLDRYYDVMGRAAFEQDYTSMAGNAGGPPATPAD